MSDDINYIDIIEFQDEGYLHELNRRFLHPLGLALEIRQGWTREDVEELLKEKGVQFGHDAVDNCMTIVHHLGLDEKHLGGVWDYRDDPDGMNYGDDLLNETKAARIAAIEEGRKKARLESVGYWIQPVEADPK